MDQKEFQKSFKVILKMLLSRWETFNILTRKGLLCVSHSVSSIHVLISWKYKYLFPFLGFSCRFNWGLSVTKLSQRILKLVQSEQLLTEERARARKLTREIKGFGSFVKRSSSDDYDSFRDSFMRRCGRSSSHYKYYQNQHDKFLDSNESFLINKSNEKEEKSIKKVNSLPEKPRKNLITERHPFFDNDELETKTSLLSNADWSLGNRKN